jgi:spore coat polysaccharide biosynthesis protein SpsF
MKTLVSNIELSGIDVNEQAIKMSRKILPEVKYYQQSFFDFEVDYARDFILTAGSLMYVISEMLNKFYNILYKSSSKYILINEYYNTSPVSIKRRDQEDFIWKRDFAGEMMDLYPDLKLVAYDFVYHRDNNFPLDDITWFLLQK